VVISSAAAFDPVL